MTEMGRSEYSYADYDGINTAAPANLQTITIRHDGGISGDKENLMSMILVEKINWIQLAS